MELVLLLRDRIPRGQGEEWREELTMNRGFASLTTTLSSSRMCQSSPHGKRRCHSGPMTGRLTDLLNKETRQGPQIEEAFTPSERHLASTPFHGHHRNQHGSHVCPGWLGDNGQMPLPGA
jgi:hypothetical protein